MREARGSTGRYRVQAATGSLVLAAVLLVSACGEKQQAQQTPPAPPAVGVMAVTSKPINPSTGFTGRVQAIDKVDLLARINGFLDKRLFQEGQHVNVGDLLFVIEQPPYQAQLDQKAAELDSAEAAQKNTSVQLARAQQLVKTNNIPQATLDQRQAEDTMAKSQILEAKAALEQAQINFAYTEIKAPISGRIGQSTFTVGSYLTPQSGTLATIVSQDPIYVLFPISVRDLETIREARRKEGGGLNKIDILVRLANGQLYAHPGIWNFTDPQVDQQTDTLIMRAAILNPEGTLADGQVITAIIRERKEEPRLVIPQTALQVDQSGYYALIVNGEHKVEVRRLKTGPNIGTDVVVQSGLKEGDKVIVDGIQKVRPGQTVQETVLPTPASSG